MITLDLPTFRKAYPRLPLQAATLFLPFLNQVFVDINASDAIVAAAFLAQVAAETNQLTMWTEGWTDSDAQKNYINITRLGNLTAEDCFAYRGRGPVQITGRDTYRRAGLFIGVNLEANPDLVVTDPSVGFKTASWYWNQGTPAIQKAGGITPFALAGNFDAVTRGINAGNPKSTAKTIYGVSDREKYYFAIRLILGVDPSHCDGVTDNAVTTTPALDDKARENAAIAPLKSYQNYKAALVRKHVNASPAPKLQATAGLPVLPLATFIGWRPASGTVFNRDLVSPKSSFVSFPVPCAVINNVYLERFTVYDFLLMQRAATQDGISLYAAIGYRTWDDQEKLFYERRDPKIQTTRGYAHPPGWSHHHWGTSIDIPVGLTLSQFQSGLTNDTLVWLQANAGNYGFVGDHDEPWHWEHNDYKIFGQAQPEELTSILQNIGAAADEAIDRGQSELKRFMARQQYEDAQVKSRSAQMGTSTASTFKGEAAAGACYSGASASAKMAFISGQITTNSPLLTFDKSALGSMSYDFKTGLWGDETA